MNLFNIIAGIASTFGLVLGLIALFWGGIAYRKTNKFKAKGETIQQAEYIINGLDTYAVVKLTRDTTRDEFENNILPCIVEGFEQRITEIEERQTWKDYR